MKPEGYPLPWCERLDKPYFKINFMLCMTREGWWEYQKGIPMYRLIPEIDQIIEEAYEQRCSNLAL